MQRGLAEVPRKHIGVLTTPMPRHSWTSGELFAIIIGELDKGDESPTE